VDLTDAVLRNANLNGVNAPDLFAFGATCINASFVGATLVNAFLRATALAGANFTDADLTGATIDWADAQGANFQDADLTDSFLANTNFSSANFQGAILTGASYDSLTVFPSGFNYSVSPWDLDANQTTPWDAGMIPIPEPSHGWLMLTGVSGLVGLTRLRRR
jgi:hypothetical protein